MTIGFSLNGVQVSTPARSVDRLSDLLRDKFGLLGVQSDCRTGRCGRCLVFMDEKLIPSCLVPVFRARGTEITSIEGLMAQDEGKDIAAAFHDSGLVTCGFCDTAKIMTVANLLRQTGHPGEEIIIRHLSSASCRCTDPVSMVRAVVKAAEYRAKRLYNRAGQ